MIEKDRIKALAFDFGGTLDSPFMHWANLYIKIYNEKLGLRLTRDTFWDSYVAAEREMERLQPVKPTDGLQATQSWKAKLQFAEMTRRGIVPDTEYNRTELPVKAAEAVTEVTGAYIAMSRRVLERLSTVYRLLLVSNFYGNLKTIVGDFGMTRLFLSITDSTVVGIRKPDPAIWQLAFDGVGLEAGDVLVVGDSMKNDMRPALSLGCQVVKCCADGEEHLEGLTCITELEQLVPLLL